MKRGLFGRGGRTLQKGQEPETRSKRWVFLGALSIALGAALAVAILHQQADGLRRNQLILADIERLARQLRTAERALGAGSFPLSENPFEHSLEAALQRLEESDPSGDAALNVVEAGSAYIESAMEHIRLERAGRGEEAKSFDDSQAETAFGVFMEAVYHASNFYSAQATRSLWRANAGSTVAIAIQALFIALLFVLAERTRRAGELRLAEQRARKDARFRSLVQNSSDVITVLGPSGEIRYLSPAVQRVLGCLPEERLDASAFDFVHAEDLQTAQEAFNRILNVPESNLTLELRVRHARDSWRWIELSATNLLSDSNVGGIVLNFRDVSERKELEEQLRHQTLHDALTGLANRVLFQNLLARSISSRRDRQVAVFYIDLDNFKQVNDLLGHEAGDRLLLQVAERLRSSVRPEDTAARLGGDEFALITEGMSHKEAVNLATRLLVELARPFELAGHTMNVGASVGIAVARAGDCSSENLLRDADVAMYVAKSSGKGRFAVFEPGMYRRVKQQLEMELDLRYALENEQFELHYQPIITLETGQMIAVEALVRWHDRNQSRTLPAGEFLPVAERTGLTIPLGRWILEHGCRQMRDWQTRFPETAPLALSINCSERQFHAPDFLETVGQTLAASGLPGEHLILELSEDLILNYPKAAQEKIAGLKRLGVRVAIDNFGGGLSSLRQLQRLPIDVVKIHKSFVESATLDSVDSELTHSLIDLAKRLKLQTIAEGIELDRQAVALGKMGCEMGQGYYLARPLDPRDLEEMLEPFRCGSWKGTLVEKKEARR